MDHVVSSNSNHSLLAASLASELSAGAYPLGARFPTEKELQERFGVGRHTVREALKILTEQGLIGRRRKTGTVVLSHQPVAPYVHSLRDFRGLLDFAKETTIDIRHEGFVTIKRKPDDFFESPDTRWLRLAGVRSRSRDMSPLCWSEVMVPESFAPDRTRIALDKAIYETVMEEFGLRLEYVEQKVSATHLPAQIAGLLNAEPGGAALLVERRYVAHTGATFEVSQNLYPSERYSIRTVIRQRT